MIVSRFLISKAGAGKDAYSCFLQQLKGVKNVGQLIERFGFGHCFVWQLNLGWIVRLSFVLKWIKLDHFLPAENRRRRLELERTWCLESNSEHDLPLMLARPTILAQIFFLEKMIRKMVHPVEGDWRYNLSWPFELKKRKKEAQSSPDCVVNKWHTWPRAISSTWVNWIELFILVD